MDTLVVKNHTVASVHYRGTLTNTGEVFDHSEGRGPLEFIVGFRQMIPGFEAALMGKSVGEKLTFDLSPEEAYGEHDPQGVKTIPLSQLPDEIAVGQSLAIQTPEGQVIPIRVTEKTEESATLDMNHKLAGKALTFEVEIVALRDAEAEEISRGMVRPHSSNMESDCCRTGSCSS